MKRLLLMLVWLTACGAAQPVASVDQLPSADGQRHTLVGSQASLVVPKTFKQFDVTTWIWPLGQDRAIVLHVQRAQEPAGGVQAAIDARVREMETNGQAGVERDRTVGLGDLEGRMVQAVELVQRPPRALWLLVVVAEDGVYTVTATGYVDDLRKRQADVEGAMLSLRVPLPKGGTVGPKAEPKPEPGPAPELP